MDPFKEQHFGVTLSEDLVNYLKKHTTIRDRGIVSKETGVGTSIIRDVSFGYRSLTEDNSKAIIALIKISLKKLNKSVTETESIEEVKFIKDSLEELQSA